MPSLTAGQTGTFTLDAFGYIDVVAQGDGTLSGVSRAPSLKSNVAVSRLASVRYGPYGVPMDVTVACTNGTITYATTAGYSGTAASVAANNVTVTDSGGYFTGADVESVLQELGAGALAVQLMDFRFSGAASYIARNGGGKLYGVFLESFPNLATIQITDGVASGGPVVLATVTNSTGGTLTNYSVPGIPSTGLACTAGLWLIATGVTVGRVYHGE